MTSPPVAPGDGVRQLVVPLCRRDRQVGGPPVAHRVVAEDFVHVGGRIRGFT